MVGARGVPGLTRSAPAALYQFVDARPEPVEPSDVNRGGQAQVSLSEEELALGLRKDSRRVGEDRLGLHVGFSPLGRGVVGATAGDHIRDSDAEPSRPGMVLRAVASPALLGKVPPDPRTRLVPGLAVSTPLKESSTQAARVLSSRLAVLGKVTKCSLQIDHGLRFRSERSRLQAHCSVQWSLSEPSMHSKSVLTGLIARAL
jgi:hypothetical protein